MSAVLHMDSDSLSLQNKAWNHTPEAKEKIRLAHLGKKLSVETKTKIGNSNRKPTGRKPPNFGKKLSLEERQRLSESHKGKPWSERRRLAFETQRALFSIETVPNTKCVRYSRPVYKKSGPGNIACEVCRVKSRKIAKAGHVRCEICSLFFRTLATHVVSKHSITPTIYMERFPESPIQLYKQVLSPEACLKISAGQKLNWSKKSESDKESRREILRGTYREGRLVPSEVGYGKGSYYKTPLQGRVWLRSTSEVQRALELDSEGLVWFYELKSFPVLRNSRRTTYRPDFWVISGMTLNSITQDYSSFLDAIPQDLIHIEDVKGWWSERHSDYEKIQDFKRQYPEIKFEVVVRKGFKWGAAGSPARDLVR